MATHDVSGPNAAYVAQLREDFDDSPASIPDEWREIFESAGTASPSPTLPDGNGAAAAATLAEPATLVETVCLRGAGESPTSPQAATGAAAGSRRAPRPAGPRRGPAGRRRGGDGPRQGLSHARAPRGTARSARLRAHGRPGARRDAARAAAHARAAGAGSRPASCASPCPGRPCSRRCRGSARSTPGSSAYEIEHISDHAERVWLRKAIESGRFRVQLEPAERLALLRRLAQVEGFEQYLRRSFLGQKQFSLEGMDVLIPMLDEAIGSQPRVGRTRS